MSEFGDYDPRDAISGDDEQIDWGRVGELEGRYAAVLEIEDDEERLAAAKALVAELNA